jgi:hypothetical protein
MGIWQKISSWWNKDVVEAATEDARDDSPAERDLDQEDYEARKDDVLARGETLAGGAGDYERDSEPPRDPTP